MADETDKAVEERLADARITALEMASIQVHRTANTWQTDDAHGRLVSIELRIMADQMAEMATRLRAVRMVGYAMRSKGTVEE